MSEILKHIITKETKILRKMYYFQQNWGLHIRIVVIKVWSKCTHDSSCNLGLAKLHGAHVCTDEEISLSSRFSHKFIYYVIIQHYISNKLCKGGWSHANICYHTLLIAESRSSYLQNETQSKHWKKKCFPIEQAALCTWLEFRAT